MHRHRGISLLELVLVMVVLGVIAAVAIPRFGSGADNSQEIATRTSLRRLQQKVDEYHALYGTFPEELMGEWFADGQVPVNPMAQGGDQARKYFEASSASTHPTFKYMLDQTAWWYNAKTGWVRARVRNLKDDEATLALYNDVNSAVLTDLTQVVDPDGAAEGVATPVDPE